MNVWRYSELRRVKGEGDAPSIACASPSPLILPPSSPQDMNFDATHIVIRERGFGEIMDLALKVACAHAGPLLLALAVGAAPWALINALLLNAMVSPNEILDNSAGFVLLMLMLVAEDDVGAPGDR